MKYQNVIQCTFIKRLNRFVGEILIDGKISLCHIKNTGRCAELLIKGVTVYVTHNNAPGRKTAYTLVAVCKNELLINIDSYAPNVIANEWVSNGGLGFVPTFLKSEVKYGSSRFDLYWEYKDRRGFVEVKGVTLENNGNAMFPDAPTTRGVKHLNELISAQKDGYESTVLFVIQFLGAISFRPNEITHPEFADTLRKAKKSGVNIICRDCIVTPDSIEISNTVPLIV